MRVLVIGGTGNISSGVVSALLERNHQVVLFNRGGVPTLRLVFRSSMATVGRGKISRANCGSKSSTRSST